MAKFSRDYNIFFTQTLEDELFIEYREWYSNGKKKERYFGKKLPGDKTIVKDGPYTSWYNNGKFQQHKMYSDDNMIASYGLDNVHIFNCVRYSKIINEQYEEILQENRDGSYKYSIDHK